MAEIDEARTSSDSIAAHTADHNLLHQFFNDIRHEATAVDHVDTDLFDDTSINAAWTQLIVSGTATWTEDKSVLSVHATNQTADDYAAIGKPITSFVTPSTIDTRVKFASLANGTFSKVVGIFFSDGITATDNVVAFLYFSAGDLMQMRGFSGTFTLLNTGEGTSFNLGNNPFHGGWGHLRLVSQSANNWEVLFSIDGVTYFSLDSSFAQTMTPTHFGLLVGTNSGSEQMLATFDHFVVTDSDLS